MDAKKEQKAAKSDPQKSDPVNDSREKVIIKENPGDDTVCEKNENSASVCVEDNLNSDSETTGIDEQLKEVKDKLEEKERDLAQQQDKYLRLYAEFENYKKRKEEEKLSILRAANEKVFKEILPVIDSFDLALLRITDVDKSSSELAKGFEMIYKQILTFLNKHQISTIDAVGKNFDPNYHSALMQEESADHDPDIVIKEVQKGYLFHGKVLRPTMVVVSK